MEMRFHLQVVVEPVSSDRSPMEVVVLLHVMPISGLVDVLHQVGLVQT